MEAKGHCKVHYGNGGEEEEAELEEFYDYSSRFSLLGKPSLIILPCEIPIVLIYNLTVSNVNTCFSVFLGAVMWMRMGNS